MSIPEPMLSTRAVAWPDQGDWTMEPKWDGFRLLVAIDNVWIAGHLPMSA